MKRFKLSRKEKLLFAAPLLLPLLVLAWQLVSGDSLDRRLRELAGPDAIDCGVVSRQFIASSNEFLSVHSDPCATDAFQTGKPFMVRLNETQPHTMYHTAAEAIVRTPQGQVFFLSYIRPTRGSKVILTQRELYNAQIYVDVGRQDNNQGISSDHVKNPVTIETHIWW